MNIKVFLFILIATLSAVATAKPVVDRKNCSTRDTTSGQWSFYAQLYEINCLDPETELGTTQKFFSICYSPKTRASNEGFFSNLTHGVSCAEVQLNADPVVYGKAQEVISSFSYPQNYPEIREKVTTIVSHLLYDRTEQANKMLSLLIGQN